MTPFHFRLTGCLSLALLALITVKAEGQILAQSNISVGYGYSGGSWNTTETSAANTPVSAPGPSTSFTVGDFTFTIEIGSSFVSTAGPGFAGRTLTTGGGNTSSSTAAKVVVTARYTGASPEYDNFFHLNIDQLSVYAFKHTAHLGGANNEIFWTETTVGSMATSPSVFTPVGSSGWDQASNYGQLNWDPLDTPAEGVLSMRRTFELPQDRLFMIDGFEIVCSAQVEAAPGNTGTAVAASSDFSIGYGFTSYNWNTSETSAVNTPLTAPNPGGTFALGDFSFTIDIGSEFVSSEGPSFLNRELSSGGVHTGRSTTASVTVNATYTGALPTAGTEFRLNIDQLAIYASKHTAFGTDKLIFWSETTAGHPGSSAIIETPTSPPLTTPLSYAQLGWNPPEFTVPAATSVTRTFELPQTSVFLVDGFEIVGSAELLTACVACDDVLAAVIAALCEDFANVSPTSSAAMVAAATEAMDAIFADTPPCTGTESDCRTYVLGAMGL